MLLGLSFIIQPYACLSQNAILIIIILTLFSRTLYAILFKNKWICHLEMTLRLSYIYKLLIEEIHKRSQKYVKLSKKIDECSNNSPFGVWSEPATYLRLFRETLSNEFQPAVMVEY